MREGERDVYIYIKTTLRLTTGPFNRFSIIYLLEDPIVHCLHFKWILYGEYHCSLRVLMYTMHSFLYSLS